MDGGSAFIEILLFGVVAAFLIMRLRSVLGRRMGHERDAQPLASAGERAANEDNVVSMPNVPGNSDPIMRGIAEIQRVDRSFDPEEFAVGAKTAFDLILTGFATGDRDTLRSLTDTNVYAMMDEQITDREERKETLESTLVRIRSADIVGARMQGSSALTTLKILSEQINVVRDIEGHAISGQHGMIESITDIWTFARDTSSNDPNWILVEIQEPDEIVAVTDN